MSVTVKVRNKDRLFRRLNATVSGFETEVEKANRKTAEEGAATMQRFAPRDTGALIDSIVVTYAGQQTPPYSQPGGSMVVPDGAAAITVGNTAVRYPHLVEYGTAAASAQPFFWPGYRIAVGPGGRRHRSRVTRGMNKAIKQAATKL